LLRASYGADYVNNTFSWTQQQSYVYGGSYCANDWHDWGGNANAWNFIEVWFNNSAKTYTIRVNGANVINNSSFSGCNFNFDYIWMLGFDGGGNAPPSLTWWMDDIYADNTLSRVMLGNASTYAASTKFEMQKPSVWSASSVTIAANPASFTTGQTAYLYVIDSTGAVNASGLPVTIGGGDTTPPAAPTGLGVQ
jgi:hypothetical protein